MTQKITILLTKTAVALLLCSVVHIETSAKDAAVPSKTPAAQKPTVLATTASEINWMPFDSGLTRAKKERKHMFVDFTTAWCGWCKKMEAETFSQPDVIKYVNDNFIAAKVIGDSDKELDIDGYKISERNLTSGSFRVTGYPAFAFLTPDGINMGVLPGYRPKDKMMEILEFVKEKKYDTTKVAPRPSDTTSSKKKE